MNASASIPVKSFPEMEVCDCISRFWREKADEERDNPFVRERKNTLYDVLPDLDSLEIVRFLFKIEEVIDTEIPPKFIQRGGYNSPDEMIQHLVPQLRGLCAAGTN